MKDKEESYFDKFISRPYSILQIESYNKFLEEMQEENNFEEIYPVFVYDNEQNLVHVYYDMKKLLRAFQVIGERVTKDKNFRETVFDKFIESFEKIKGYFDEEKEVKSLNEFKDFFELFKDYMKYNAYNWSLPGIGLVPTKIKERAMELRSKTESYAAKRDQILVDVTRKMLKNPKLDTFFLTYDEIKNSKINFDELIDQRSPGFLVYKDKIILKDEASGFLKANNIILREPQIENPAEIKGAIAQKGIVQGRVKLVFTKEDLGKVTSERDILVSPMTRPDFILAMKKAAAFVTDEGGIICHAGIVARELKKPCIIGTKIATKLLHDGDLVEVDANNGVVRILEKK